MESAVIDLDCASRRLSACAAAAFPGVLGGRAAAREAAHDRLPAALRRATAAGGALDEAAVTAAFVETDAWLRTVPAVQRDQSGTTCVVAGLRRRPQEAGAGAPTWDAWVANAGDSRGLLFRPGAGGAETLVASEDHKPDRPDELARIARAAAQRSDRRGASVAGAARATRRPILRAGARAAS